MVRIRSVAIVTLLALTTLGLPAAGGQEGSDEPELPPGTVTVVGEFTSGKFLDPGEVTGPDETTLVYYEYDLVEHDLVFWVFPSVDGQPTSVIGYGEVAQRTEFEMDHFLNDEPVTTRRAFTAITEMDFEGTWDGNDPGSVEGIVTWTVPEERVDVEWNEHSWGPVPSPTNGIYTGPGWTDGTFTATWSPSTGRMRGEIDTGPWNGGFEAFVVAAEPATTPPSVGSESRIRVPCFFDTAPGITPACGGEDRVVQGSGLGLLAALSDFSATAEIQESLWGRLKLPADPKQRAAKLAEEGADRDSEEPPPGFENRGLPIEEGPIYHLTRSFISLGDLVPVGGGDPPFPIFRAARPLFVALLQADVNAEGEEERARIKRATRRLARQIMMWEATGSMPRPLDAGS